MNGHHQFDQLAQGDLLLVESNGHLFRDKIDGRIEDSPVKFVEVFEQPDARDTVNDGNVERYFCNASFPKFVEFCLHLLFVEEGIFAVVG